MSSDLVDEVGDGVNDARGLKREAVDLVSLGDSREHQDVSTPASTPATMSVSMRSPTMTVDFEWAPRMLSASRIMTGFGLPTKYGFDPGGALDQRREGAAARQETVRRGSVGFGIRRHELAPAVDETNRGRELVEGVVPRLAEHHVVGVDSVFDVPNVMHRLVEARLADDEGAALGLLVVDELRRGERRGPQLLSRRT